MSEPSLGVDRIARAKAAVDRGFSRVGRTLDAADPVARVLAQQAARALGVSNAVAQLCLRRQAVEALPLARQLVEIAVAMRWVSRRDREARAREWLREAREPDWGGLWPSGRLRERAAAAGVDASLVEAALALCGPYVNGSPAGIPWGHVFEEKDGRTVSAEQVLGLADRALGEALGALRERWSEFPAPEELT